MSCAIPMNRVKLLIVVLGILALAGQVAHETGK